MKKILTTLQEKWAEYLIEICVIILGIFGALMLDNWNTQQLENEKEIQLLEQLKEDLLRTKHDFDLNLRVQKRVFESGDFVLNHMKSNMQYHDSISFNIADVFGWTTLNIDYGAYETINSHGIEIISNKELRNKVINFYGGTLNWHHVLEKRIFDSSEYFLRYEAHKYFTMHTVNIKKVKAYKRTQSIPKDYSSLRKNEGFRFHVISQVELTKNLRDLSNKSLLRKINELLLLIDNELN